MNKKIKYALQVTALSIPVGFLVSYLNTSLNLSSPNIGNANYVLYCNDPQPFRDFSVFRGGKVIEVVCQNTIDFFLENSVDLHHRRNNQGDIAHWAHIYLDDLLASNSESFFCSGKHEFKYAYILIEFIPLARKTLSLKDDNKFIMMSGQIYLLSWEIKGFEESFNWGFGHDITSSIQYIYENSEEPVKKIIESNVAGLYRASMEDFSDTSYFKANLKCIEHPKDA